MMADQEEPRQCARCGSVNDSSYAHCIRCGAPLLNRCGDEPGMISKGCTFVNSPEAAFCAKCGHPTIFNQEGIVRAYQHPKWPINLQ